MSPAGAERDSRSHDGPFAIKDCALIAIATGERALTLKELHDTLLEIDHGSIYYHMWGGLLEPRFEEREFNNDFAAWARHGLHDGTSCVTASAGAPTPPRSASANAICNTSRRSGTSRPTCWKRRIRPGSPSLPATSCRSRCRR